MTGNGSLIPNTTQYPNLFLDKLSYLLTAEEEKVLNQAVREILGWEEGRLTRSARISLSVFMNGKKVNGKRVSYGCGLCLSAIRESLKSLNEFNILIKVGRHTNDGQQYELQINADAIRWGALKSRYQDQADKNKKRTKKARSTKTGVLFECTETLPPCPRL